MWVNDIRISKQIDSITTNVINTGVSKYISWNHFRAFPNKFVRLYWFSISSRWLLRKQANRRKIGDVSCTVWSGLENFSAKFLLSKQVMTPVVQIILETWTNLINKLGSTIWFRSFVAYTNKYKYLLPINIPSVPIQMYIESFACTGLIKVLECF